MCGPLRRCICVYYKLGLSILNNINSLSLVLQKLLASNLFLRIIISWFLEREIDIKKKNPEQYLFSVKNVHSWTYKICGRKVFAKFVRFLECDNFMLNVNVKISFCFKEILTEQRFLDDLNCLFPGVYQYLILDITRNTAQMQQSKTTASFQWLGRDTFARNCLGQTDLQRERISMACHAEHFELFRTPTKPWENLLSFNCTNPRGWWEIQGWWGFFTY